MAQKILFWNLILGSFPKSLIHFMLNFFKGKKDHTITIIEPYASDSNFRPDNSHRSPGFGNRK